MKANVICLCFQVKRILQFAVFAAYHSQLELSFLRDEFALPPSNLSQHLLGFIGDSSDMEIIQGEQEAQKTGQSASTDSPSRNARSFDPSHITMDLSDTALPCEGKPSGNIASASQQMEPEKPVANTPKKALNVVTDSPSKSRGVSPSRKSLHTVLPSTEVSDHSDPLQNYQKSQDDSIFQGSDSLSVKEVNSSDSRQQFRRAMSDAVLSVSAFIKPSLPYLLTDAGMQCKLRGYFPRQIYWTGSMEPRDSPKQTDSITISPHPSTGQQDTTDSSLGLSDGLFGNAEGSDWNSMLFDHTPSEMHPFVTTKLTAPVSDKDTQVWWTDSYNEDFYC